MHPLTMLSSLRGEYEAYVDSFQFYKNPVIHQWVKDRRAEGRLLYREPFLTLAKPFLDGSPLQALVLDGTLHSGVVRVFTRVPGDPTAEVVSPFKHQEQAIRQVTGGHNTVVATGTGSGKSFTFYIPIVSAALKSAKGRGEGEFRNPLAVIIYPMNALANSQYEDIAARLAGSGLTVCNYTGDLKTTPEAALKDFWDLTGRDQPYDSEVIDRGTLHDHGCDILLTNFKMLEYALVRREDAKLFHGLNFGGRLQFLVLDEMHTYSGRQGADMALLVRRFKERTGTAGTLRCIGTSATVDSSDPEQAAIAIADFASHLFGERFDPAHVVGEQYDKPETLDLDHPSMYLAPQPVPAAVVEQARTLTVNEAVVTVLAPSLLGQDTTEDAVRACKPVAWVERALWSGVRSLHDLVAAYQAEVRPVASADEARDEIEAALMFGAAVQVPGPRGSVGLLTPKAHAFFSQGLPVTGCLGGEQPHLSEQGEATCATCTREGHPGVTAYPMVFCAACGTEFFVGTEYTNVIEARDFLDTVVAGQPFYFMTDEWDEDEVPLDPTDTLADGVTPRKGREGAVPHRMKVCGECGEIGDGCGHGNVREVVAVAANMLLCPGCGVRYDGNHSEYNKFFQVGTVGRATATDVLVTSMVNGLDKDSPRKRSVMAFTDNQQDSSFQAAHLQSLSRRFHMRRAIMQGLADIGAASPSNAVPTVDVADAAFDAMDRTKTLPVYTRQTEVKIVIGGGDDAAAKRRYMRYLQAGVLMDTSGGPRKAQPNLEDTGLIVQDYVNFAQPDELLAALRQHAGPNLKTYAESDPDFALDLLRAVLDSVRRNRAIHSQNDRGPAAVYMDPDGFDTEIVSQLNPAAIFHGGSDTLRRPVVYDEQRDGGRRITIRRLAGKINPDGTDAAQGTSLTRWVVREQGWVNDQAARVGAKTVIREARDFLRDAGYLVPRNGNGLVLAEENLRFWRTVEPVGFRCPRCSARFAFRKQRRCPRCVKVTLGEEQVGRDDFFRAAYTADLTEQVRIDAEEHTGSVSGDERKAIETRFKDRSDALNVLVCTPTMELGIDIGDLSAVYMRNVPPSPANYAQRQGRAGRAAQPSTVVTFCSAQGRTGPHDQYFFRFPEQIVAGRIAAPRFLLDNEALLRSHLNAILLGAREDDLPRDLTAWVRLDTYDAGGITAAFRQTLEEFIAANRDEIITRAKAAFVDVFAQAESVTDTLIEQVVDRFVDDLDRDMAALSEYMRELKVELDELNAKADAGGLDGTEKRRRDAIERIRNDIRSGTGDYYPLSWLAQRGFLPTYAFPRQAVLLRFNDRPEARVRSRAIALREFAPGNSVYHRGKRYQVVKASFGRDARAVLDPLIICQCGTYLNATQAAGTTKCPVCDTPLSDATPFRNAMHVVDGYAVQRDSVGADSEERLRQGYDVRTAYRLPATGVRRYDVTMPNIGIIAATYVHLGHLVRVNAGLRRSNNPGFDLCQRCRTWNPDADHFNADRECAPASENLISRVVLMTQGQHDLLLLDVTAPSGADPGAYAYTLLYALQAGIATRYGIDQNELAGEVFPHPEGISDGRRLLIHEMDEGGVGVLSRVTAENAWRETTEKALAIVHMNPDSTEQDHACIDSCYQCLRTFYNQWHHDVLDRNLIKTFLLDGVLGAAFTAQDTSDDWDDVIKTFDSETERKMVERLKAEPLRAPDAAHLGLPRSGPVAEADLYWKADGQNVVVLLDGSVHDNPTVAAADATKRRLLRDAGFTVVIIRYDALEDGIAVLGTKLGC